MKNLIKYAAVTTAAMALLCATSGRVYALAGMEVAAIDSNFLALANGQMLPAGSLIELGQFSITDASITNLASGNVLSQANYNTLLASFVPLAGGVSSGVVGQNSGGYDGSFDINFSGNNAGFASGPMYLLVFNAATSGAATQVGVFRGAGTQGNNGWGFPADMATGSTSVDMDAAKLPPLLGTYTALSAVDNGFNDNLGNGWANVNTMNLDVIVPEPSSIMLVVVGLFGMVGLIRRRRS